MAEVKVPFYGHVRQYRSIHKELDEAIRQVLVQSIDRLHLVERHYMSYFLDKKFLERSWHDHNELLEAIADRDWASQERIILRHWVHPK